MDPARVEIAGATAVLTLDRPPVNALRAADYGYVRERLAQLAGRPQVRALVLTGAGDRAFSAGTDIAELSGGDPDPVIAAAKAFFATLSAYPLPVIGVLNGPAVGAGAMIAAECDLLVARRTATISIPELTLGFPGAASHVKRLAPYFKGLRMMLLGEALTVEEAVAYGSIAAVTGTTEEALEVARGLAVRLSRLDRDALAAARSIFRAPEARHAQAGYGQELEALRRALMARSGADGAPDH